MAKFLTPFVHRVIIATLIFLFVLIYLFDVSNLNYQQDTLMVKPILWIMMVLYPIVIWQEWRSAKKQNAEKKETGNEKAESEEDDTSTRLSKKVILFMVFTFAYLILMNYIGFIISTIIYMPALMWVFGTKSKKMLIALPIATAFLLFFLFNNLLGIPLPQGVLIEGVL